MRVLLVATNREVSPFPVAPIGALSVASAAQRAGVEVDLLDMSTVRSPWRVLRSAFRKHEYDAVALSIRNLDNCFFTKPHSYYGATAEMAREVRRCCDAPLILGGGGFSVSPRGWMERLWADYGIVGEGEQAFVDLLQRLESGRPAAELRGLITRDRPDGAAGPPVPAWVEDLDSLPLPAHDQCRYQRHIRRGGFVGIQTKRGCSSKCIYCVYPLLEGGKFRLRSPESVVDEIESVVARRRVRWFFFTDSVFNTPRDHALEVCRLLAQRRLQVRWMAYCNPVGFDDELARAAVSSGCAAVEFGLDAAVDKMLERMGKPFGQKEIRRAFQAASGAGLPFAVHLLFGGPTETAADVRETQRFLDDCAAPNAVFASVGIRIYENTPLQKQALGDGVLSEDQDLFEPAYYVSPGLGDDPLATVDEVVRRRPEWLSPTDWTKTSIRTIQRVLNRLGMRPNWRNVRNYGKYMRR